MSVVKVYQFVIVCWICWVVLCGFPRCGGAALYALDFCEVCLCLGLRKEQDSGATWGQRINGVMITPMSSTISMKPDSEMIFGQNKETWRKKINLFPQDELKSSMWNLHTMILLAFWIKRGKGLMTCQVKIPISCDKAMTTDSCLRCLALRTTLHRFPNFRSVFLSRAFAKQTSTWKLEHTWTCRNHWSFLFAFCFFRFFLLLFLLFDAAWVQNALYMDSGQLQVIPIEVWCVRALELVVKLWCVHGASNLLHEKSYRIWVYFSA